jgi:hypothetical protein
VPANYTREDIIAAFRREVMKAHPDRGGTVEQFRLLVEARDRLLNSIGTSAAQLREPTFAPKGVKLRYRPVSLATRQARLGHTRRLAAG